MLAGSCAWGGCDTKYAATSSARSPSVTAGAAANTRGPASARHRASRRPISCSSLERISSSGGSRARESTGSSRGAAVLQSSSATMPLRRSWASGSARSTRIRVGRPRCTSWSDPRCHGWRFMTPCDRRAAALRSANATAREPGILLFGAVMPDVQRQRASACAARRRERGSARLCTEGVRGRALGRPARAFFVGRAHRDPRTERGRKL